MSLEQTISLSKASRIVGVHKKTLRRWLRVDLGIEFGPRARLVRLVDVETVQRMHAGSRMVYTLRNQLHP
jgi:transposase-like protein